MQCNCFWLPELSYFCKQIKNTVVIQKSSTWTEPCNHSYRSKPKPTIERIPSNIQKLENVSFERKKDNTVDANDCRCGCCCCCLFRTSTTVDAIAVAAAATAAADIAVPAVAVEWNLCHPWTVQHGDLAHEASRWSRQGRARRIKVCVFFWFVIFLRLGHQQRSPYSVGRWPQICVVSKAVMWCGVVHPLWRTECSVWFRFRACKKLRTLVFAFILVSFRPWCTQLNGAGVCVAAVFDMLLGGLGDDGCDLLPVGRGGRLNSACQLCSRHTPHVSDSKRDDIDVMVCSHWKRFRTYESLTCQASLVKTRLWLRRTVLFLVMITGVGSFSEAWLRPPWRVLAAD